MGFLSNVKTAKQFRRAMEVLGIETVGVSRGGDIAWRAHYVKQAEQLGLTGGEGALAAVMAYLLSDPNAPQRALVHLVPSGRGEPLDFINVATLCREGLARPNAVVTAMANFIMNQEGIPATDNDYRMKLQQEFRAML